MGKRYRITPESLRRILHLRTVPRNASSFSSRYRSLLMLAFTLSACVDNPTGIQGRWVGTVTPVAGTCDPASQAVLVIHTGRTLPDAAIFSPTSGVLTLYGTSDGTTEVTADLQTLGANHQSYTMSFNGRKTGETISGIYVTQRCRADVQLHRG